MRKVGVEEELLLVDPDTGRLCPVAERALRAYEDEAPDGAAEVVPELFRQQVEAVTEPCMTLDQLEAQLSSGRRTVTTLSDQVGAAAVAMPTPVLSDDDVDDITREPRYERIRAEFGELARTSLVCAMHVHVQVADADEGVPTLDAIGPWLPVLLAVSANSPYFLGRDTGYASWRTQIRSRWPSSGTGEAFGSARAYDEVRRQLTQWGAALDDGMLYFDARLSANFPTLEVRVADVCTDLDDALLVAALTRALVTTAVENLGNPAEAGLDHDGQWRSELLRAATWRASRYGLSNRLVHPATMQLAPPREVLAYLINMLRPALENDGDLRLVQDLTERLLSRGGGATRQRRVFETDGSLEAVVADLARQTKAAAAR